MKIEHTQTLKIATSAAVKSALGGIPKGGRVDARVLERLPGNQAVIELMGKRITAEFLKGVPKGDLLELVLESRRGSSFVFRLSGKDAAARLLGEVEPYLLGGEERFRSSKGNLRELLDRPFRLFDLNRILAGLKSGSTGEPLAYFLNGFLKMGIKSERLRVFSYLLGIRKGINSGLPMSLAAVLTGSTGILPGTPEEWDLWLEDFSGELRDLAGREEGRKHFQILMEHPGVYGNGPDGEYELPFPDGDEFKTMKVLQDGDCVICSLSLSMLGYLELYAREQGDDLFLSILCESDKSVEILTRELHDLHDRLMSIHSGGCYIGVRDAAGITEKAVKALGSLFNDPVVDVRA